MRLKGLINALKPSTNSVRQLIYSRKLLTTLCCYPTQFVLLTCLITSSRCGLTLAKPSPKAQFTRLLQILSAKSLPRINRKFMVRQVNFSRLLLQVLRTRFLVEISTQVWEPGSKLTVNTTAYLLTSKSVKNIMILMSTHKTIKNSLLL